MLHLSLNPYLVFSLSCGWLLLTISSLSLTLTLILSLTILLFILCSWRLLLRLIGCVSYSARSPPLLILIPPLFLSLWIMCSLCVLLFLMLVNLSPSPFLYHFSDITSPYLAEYIQLRGRSTHNAHLQKCFTSLLSRVRHFEWISSIDSSAPLRYCVRIRCQGNEASIPLTCPPVDRLYHLSNPQWDLMAQRR
eukprot:g80232.t1